MGLSRTSLIAFSWSWTDTRGATPRNSKALIRKTTGGFVLPGVGIYFCPSVGVIGYFIGLKTLAICLDKGSGIFAIIALARFLALDLELLFLSGVSFDHPKVSSTATD